MRLPVLMKKGRDERARTMGDRERGWLAAACCASLAGCVQVAAPERPIEINLNINIRQEVVVRLQQDAQELIQNNPGVF